MDYLLAEHIIFNRDMTTKKQVVEAISAKAVELGISDHQEGLIKSFMDREELGSTGFGSGLAIPHAKSEYVERVAVIIVKSEIPIEWESIDKTPVYIAIALLVPEENANNVHLKVLSSISRKLVNEEFKNCIFEAETAADLVQLFEGIITE